MGIIKRSILFSFLVSLIISVVFAFLFKKYDFTKWGFYYKNSLSSTLVCLSCSIFSIIFIVIYMYHYQKTSLGKSILHVIFIIYTIIMIILNIGFIFNKGFSGIIVFFNLWTYVFVIPIAHLINSSTPDYVQIFVLTFLNILPVILLFSTIVNKMKYKGTSKRYILALFYLQSINYLTVTISIFIVGRYM